MKKADISLYWGVIALLFCFIINQFSVITINWWIIGILIFIGTLISIYKSKKNSTYIKNTLSLNATNRDPKYDYIRCIAVFLVIVFHTLNWDLSIAAELKGTGIYTSLDAIRWFSLICNMLFIMLSGALLLQNKKEGAIAFYKKRLIKIVAPLVLYFVWYLWQYGILESLSVAQVAKRIIFMNLDDSHVPHFWLIYIILLIYLFVPVLRVMLSSISYKGLTFLVLCTGALSVYGTYSDIFDNKVVYAFGWILTAVVGFWVSRPETRKVDYFLMMAGVAGTVYLLLANENMSNFEMVINNLSIFRFLICLGVFALFFKLSDKLVNFYPIRIVSKYSYGIMLIHMWVLYFVNREILSISSVMYHGFPLLLSSVITLIGSLIMAYFIDNYLVVILLNFF